MTQVISTQEAKNNVHPTGPKVTMPLTTVHKVEADGVQVFYREAGEPGHQWFFCFTGFRHRRSCFVNSFPVLLIATT